MKTGQDWTTARIWGMREREGSTITKTLIIENYHMSGMAFNISSAIQMPPQVTCELFCVSM